MFPGRGLELQRLAGGFAGFFDFAQQRVAAGIEKLQNPSDLVLITVVAAGGLTGPQTEVHFSVDATGVIGRRVERLLAAPDSKEIEKSILKAFRGGAAAERSIKKSARPRSTGS